MMNAISSRCRSFNRCYNIIELSDSLLILLLVAPSRCCQPPLLKYLIHWRSLVMSLRMRIKRVTISVTSLTLKCMLLQKEIVSILQKRIRTLSPHSHTQITLDIQCYLAIGRDKKDDCLESTRVETKKNVAYINQLPALSGVSSYRSSSQVGPIVTMTSCTCRLKWSIRVPNEKNKKQKLPTSNIKCIVSSAQVGPKVVGNPNKKNIEAGSPGYNISVLSCINTNERYVASNKSRVQKNHTSNTTSLNFLSFFLLCIFLQHPHPNGPHLPEHQMRSDWQIGT